MKSSWGRLPDIIRGNKDTFSKLLFFSVALAVVGIGSFLLISKSSVGNYFADTQSGKDTTGAIVSVVLTNVIIAAYVISAFNEPDEAPRPGQFTPGPDRAGGARARVADVATAAAGAAAASAGGGVPSISAPTAAGGVEGKKEQ